MYQYLEVQNFLKTRTFGELAKEWGVYARCDRMGYKFSLNYDQLEYTPGHYPTAQCRGLILSLDRQKDVFIPNKDGKVDENFCPGTTRILAYPFDKFFNEQEVHAAKLEWNHDTVVMDKMDGTLCIVYWDPIKSDWCVATRSVPDADLPLDGWPDWSFRKLFEKGIQDTFDVPMSEWMKVLPRKYTYMFELTSPYNRVFVNYKDTYVTLLGMRDLSNLEEVDPDVTLRLLGLYDKYIFARPKKWNLGSPAAIQAYVNGRSPEECEGAVAVDMCLKNDKALSFDRIKIKNIHWCTANATKTSLGTSPRNLMRYVLSGISDDITSMLPEDLRAKLYEMQDGVAKLFKETDASFSEWKEEAGTNRKHFAELVETRAKWTAPYYKMYTGKFVSSADFVRDMIVREKLGENMIDSLIKLVAHT